MVLTIEPLQCKISKLSLNGQKQLLKWISLCAGFYVWRTPHHLSWAYRKATTSSLTILCKSSKMLRAAVFYAMKMNGDVCIQTWSLKNHCAKCNVKVLWWHLWLELQMRFESLVQGLIHFYFLQKSHSPFVFHGKKLVIFANMPFIHPFSSAYLGLLV